jgi:hypothetical protein
MKILQQIILGFYLVTYFIICLSIGLFGYEFISYYARIEKIAFLPYTTVLSVIGGIAVFVMVILALLSRWIIPRGQKSRVVLLLIIWILIGGGYKCLKLPNNYEVDRFRHIISNVTGFDKQQNTVTDQRRSPKLRDISMRPENTTFEGERYLKTEVIRQFNLPLKLRFAAGNLESKKVDTIPIKITCFNEKALTKTDIYTLKPIIC